MSVYVVVENGDVYPVAYTTYKSAVAAVKEKYRITLEEQMEEMGYMESDIDVPESKSATTYLYIEKGIHISINRLPIMN